MPAKHLSIDVQWNLEHLAGYLKSRSSVQHFIKANGFNPVDAFLARLQDQWQEEKEIPF